MWQSNVTKCNFSDFESLNNFIKISNWENQNSNIEAKVKSLVYKHLNEIQQNFGVYFPDDDYLYLNSLLWIVQPFTNKNSDLGHLTQGWANFLARGLHLDVEFVRGPHYSNL